ncbi:hypothetical protein CAMGR0001_0714 [Campylobacter gracilis RM3268]|uniref:Uncharacterized protein n=1 Tax=Campylobacter gracilis RM3268 TaxID=553220 RepID=C8PFS2_9BACT|nr:hypothetical protein CAMGR0001_0714 [Campylobacter gracilis RM3268]
MCIKFSAKFIVKFYIIRDHLSEAIYRLNFIFSYKFTGKFYNVILLKSRLKIEKLCRTLSLNLEVRDKILKSNTT